MYFDDLFIDSSSVAMTALAWRWFFEVEKVTTHSYGEISLLCASVISFSPFFLHLAQDNFLVLQMLCITHKISHKK